MSLRLDAGEHVTLVGASGAGKSSLLALLVGFATPDSGTIMVDGRPLADLDPGAWRRRIGWLPQRPTIFHGTLRMNLLLGREDAPDEVLRDALRQAHVQEFLPRLPQGLDTVLGESGQGLSVGQAQRVALARLFLRSPTLVLLDEPTAHLDDESARLVSDGISGLRAGRTALIVSHRLASTDGRTVRLASGRLEAS